MISLPAPRLGAVERCPAGLACGWRQGITLRKSRTRDPLALDYGWALDDPRAGRHLTNLTLDQVERYLDRRELPIIPD